MSIKDQRIIRSDLEQVEFNSILKSIPSSLSFSLSLSLSLSLSFSLCLSIVVGSRSYCVGFSNPVRFRSSSGRRRRRRRSVGIMHGFPVISVVSGRDLRIQAAAESINGPVDNTAPPIGRIYLVAPISCLRENRRRNPC